MLEIIVVISLISILSYFISFSVNFISSKQKRIESWQRKFGNELSIDSATPNEGHKKIAEIMRIKDSFLITQNVDNLHQDSGIDDSKICLLYTSPSPRDQRGSGLPGGGL